MAGLLAGVLDNPGFASPHASLLESPFSGVVPGAASDKTRPADCQVLVRLS
ncbi:MAG: hypothetical protein ACYTBY_10665 [Planctomycetota bacterium]